MGSERIDALLVAEDVLAWVGVIVHTIEVGTLQVSLLELLEKIPEGKLWLVLGWVSGDEHLWDGPVKHLL